MSSLFVYFVLMLDGISLLFTIISSLSAVFALFFCVAVFCYYFDHTMPKKKSEKALKKYLPFLRYSFILLIIFTLLSLAVPSTEEAIIIYALPKIYNNEEVQKIPPKFLNILNKKLDEWSGKLDKVEKLEKVGKEKKDNK